MAEAQAQTITRDDLEGKLRQIEDVVDDAVISWIPVILGGIAVVAAVAIFVGIRRSRRQPPVTIEVYHNT